MNLSYQNSAHQLIVYDADCIQQPEAGWFDPVYWQARGAINGQAPGRGSSLMLDTPFGKAVLRTFLRGGWMAHLTRDQYLFTGYHRSRPVVEINLLAHMQTLNLPAPQPLAGLCHQNGLTYSGALLTRRIEPAFPLADIVRAEGHKEIAWFEVGKCIRRFHSAGVVHPDLNVRNILLGADQGGQGDVYLIDFDRAYVRKGASRSFRSNLARLHRSLRKDWPQGHELGLPACWQALEAGYNSAG